MDEEADFNAVFPSSILALGEEEEIITTVENGGINMDMVMDMD